MFNFCLSFFNKKKNKFAFIKVIITELIGTFLFRIVLVLVGQVPDAFRMNVYLDVRNPRGSGFWDEGYMSKGREMESLVYEQPGNEVDGSYHRKEGSK